MDGASLRYIANYTMNELDLLLVRAQSLEYAVDAVAGEAKDRIHTPVNEALYQYIGYGLPFVGSHKPVIPLPVTGNSTA